MFNIKVAIIGAGVAGLACAQEFKKYGYTPTIFEKKSQVGEILDYRSLYLKIFTRHYCDPLYYLKQTFNIDLHPLINLSEITMKFPKRNVVVKGDLGYIFERSFDSNSLENQIYKLIDFPVIFESEINIQNIRNQYDFVIVASGENKIAQQLNNWTTSFTTYNRIASITGNFNLGTANVWLDPNYCKNGFCYCISKNNTEASLVQIINEEDKSKVDEYWNKFLDLESIKTPISKKIDILTYSGNANSIVLDNIYFVGNAAGLTDDLIGIGAYNSIISGCIVAQSIIKKMDYKKIMQPYINDIKHIHELRKAYNTLNKKDSDNFAKYINNPLIKLFIYNNPFFKIRNTWPLAKVYNYIKKS